MLPEHLGSQQCTYGFHSSFELAFADWAKWDPLLWSSFPLHLKSVLTGFPQTTFCSRWLLRPVSVMMSWKKRYLRIKCHNKDEFLIVCNDNDNESSPGNDWQALILSHGSSFSRGRACGLVVWAVWLFAYFHQGCPTLMTLKSSKTTFLFLCVCSQPRIKRNNTIMSVLASHVK